MGRVLRRQASSGHHRGASARRPTGDLRRRSGGATTTRPCLLDPPLGSAIVALAWPELDWAAEVPRSVERLGRAFLAISCGTSRNPPEAESAGHHRRAVGGFLPWRKR